MDIISNYSSERTYSIKRGQNSERRSKKNFLIKIIIQILLPVLIVLAIFLLIFFFLLEKILQSLYMKL